MIWRIGGIADRVGRDLEAVRGRGIGEAQHLGIRMELQPARFRLVGIRLLQPRAARAERAIGEQFDPDRAQMIAVQPAGRLGHRRDRFRARANSSSAGRSGARPRPRGGTRSSRRPWCSSRRRRSRHSRAGSPATWRAPRSICGRGRLRDRLVDEVARIIDEHAVVDFAARRRLSRRGDAGGLQRRAVGDHRMAIDPLQHDRPVADDGIEVGRRSGTSSPPTSPGSSRSRRSTCRWDAPPHNRAAAAEAPRSTASP